MKYLFISDIGSPWGGSEELWSQAAKRLKKEGNQVHASIGFFGELHKKTQELDNLGIKLLTRKNKINLLFQKAKNSIPRLEKLKILPETFKHIIKVNPELVILSQSSAYSMFREMLFCKANGFKYISVTQLNSEYSWPNDSNFKDIQNANAGAEMNYFVSHGNLNLFYRQIGKKLENCKVISNPFNFKELKEVEWPSEKHYNLAYVGRLDFSHKGIDILLSAFCNSEWKNRNATLNIYGKGNTELAKSLIKSLGGGNIVFKGHVDGIQKLWAENHVMVIASRYEGMPLSVIEAMFCKRPVIATDVAGHGEYIVEGETGFLAEASKIDLFSNALERAWKQRDKWKELGENAFLKVKQISSSDPVGIFIKEIKRALL